MLCHHSRTNTISRGDACTLPSHHFLAPQLWAFLTNLIFWACFAQAADYAVKPDGSGSYTTIQACANAIVAGDRCVVYGGVYDEWVQTVRGGTSDLNRVTFKASGVVTMKGFGIKHAYVTVDGFDITGFTTQYSGLITVYAGGSNCQIFNNTIRDGLTNVSGIYIYTTKGLAANQCAIRGNKLSNLLYTFLTVFGDHHLFENNVFEYQNKMDYVRLFGSGSVFRRNIFWKGSQTTTGNHPDSVQNFGTSYSRSDNHLFEENWISDLPSQLFQLNSGDGDVQKGVLYDNVKNITFRRNVFANIEYNANIAMPGVSFENNTFYRLAYGAGGHGIDVSGALSRGDGSHVSLRNNVFLAGGNLSTTGFYLLAGAAFSVEVIAVFVTGETIGVSPIASAIHRDLVATGYIDANGYILTPAMALTDISQFILGNPLSVYRQDVYKRLTESVQLNDSMLRTFTADYNYVAGSTFGFPGKSAANCPGSGTGYTSLRFCEPHGINGGDPRLANLVDLLGPDGIPFTLDDGLKPLPTSPLCGKGEGGADIGAYSCDPRRVFSDRSGPGPPSAPSSLRVGSVK